MDTAARILNSVIWRAALGIALLAIGACARVTTSVRETPLPPEPPAPIRDVGRYEPAPQRSPEFVATLRAAPAPGMPEIADGRTLAGDERLLRAQGFMRIGDGYFPSDDPGARDLAIAQGQRAGADKVLLYPPAPAAGGTGAADGAIVAPPLRATYFVRFKLPFGASFRSLNQKERQALGSDEGVQIGVVIGGSPADDANLRSGDLVLKLDGNPVTNKAAFQKMLKANAGKRVLLTVVRDGVSFDRMIRIGSAPTSTVEVR
jgi:PDZ domain